MFSYFLLLQYEVVRLLKEMDLAESLKKKIDIEAVIEHQTTLSGLKPKGLHLFKTTSSDTSASELVIQHEEIDRSRNVLKMKSDPPTGEFNPNYSISMPPITDDTEDNVNAENKK